MTIGTPSFSQISKFDDLKNKMFFNKLIYSPDSSVIDFVKKYYPMFYSPPQRDNSLFILTTRLSLCSLFIR